jgi:aminoglycoside/choline kinase family phosphotransferase
MNKCIIFRINDLMGLKIQGLFVSISNRDDKDPYIC